MIILGIDTATRITSVGLLNEGRQVVERNQPSARSLVATILRLVQETLTAANCSIDVLDLIAVSAGPGSFTGLRIGLSVAKGLALSTARPIIGVPTLEALAYVALRRSSEHENAFSCVAGSPVERPDLICPVLDARRGEVYGALFRRTGSHRLERLTTDLAVDPRSLVAEIKDAADDQSCTMIGDGAEPYRLLWDEATSAGVDILPFPSFHPSGSMVAKVGGGLFAERGGDLVGSLVPRYCRAAYAEAKQTGVPSVAR